MDEREVTEGRQSTPDTASLDGEPINLGPALGQTFGSFFGNKLDSEGGLTFGG
jgi:hypothetical protein